jgi:S-adenosylmethionine synthetase
MRIIIEPLTGTPVSLGKAEIVERKGAGHPDTLCDQVAEELSIAFSRHYLEKAGRILHHNLDKCVLAGGRSEVSYGGGRVLAPMELILIGRASDGAFPLEDVARDAAERLISRALRNIDIKKDIKVYVKIRPGSHELVTVFESPASMPLANDTSIGVGYAPLSPLESLVLELDGYLSSTPFKALHPEAGEDLKIMAVRDGAEVRLAIAVAFVDRHVRSADDYLGKKRSLAVMLEQKASDLYGGRVRISLNAADRGDEGVFYLTVTGTSAESGDDGAVGRGNRVNGLITPYRTMVMEAAAGKNPVNHVGKLYNVAASNMAFALTAIDGVYEAQVYMVSLIGSPIDQPQLINVKVRSELSDKELHHAVNGEAQKVLEGIGELWRGLLDSSYRLF